jgi:prepilin-type N-terminal cleavage/methylation domain-containing protein
MYQPRHAPRVAGFTLLELLVVVTLIAILAGIAIPSLLSSRTAANERSVVATLRSIATAVLQTRNNTSVDTDRDGQGEALSLPEMAGSINLRGTAYLLDPTIMPPVFGQLNANGYVDNKGYYFALYLPDASGAGLNAEPANFASIDADLAETFWSCVAWPRVYGTTGTASFFVNQNGEILMAKRAAYDGTNSVPPPGAALLGVGPLQINTNRLASSTLGADGNLWTRAQ